MKITLIQTTEQNDQFTQKWEVNGKTYTTESEYGEISFTDDTPQDVREVITLAIHGEGPTEDGETHDWKQADLDKALVDGGYRAATSSPLKFSLGQVVATPGVLRAIEAAQEVSCTFLIRHQRGDWGVVSASDKRANDAALKDGSRLFSAYLLKDNTKIWIITEAVGDDGNRASTCILLPDEY